jgi:hypothetical protein
MSTAALERAKALSAAENRTIGMIANGVPLAEVLDELCRTIDSLTPGVVSTEYRTLAVSHGLRASWSQPLITSAGTVLGTFAMYYAEPRVPDAADLELIEAAGRRR